MAARLTEHGDDRVDAALVRLTGVLLLGAIMGFLDSTIVNVGIDTLAGHFDVPLGTIGWVATGYLLAVAVATPVSGWAVDRFGGKPTWLLGLTLFLAGSAGSALAWSVPALVVFRVLQGAGAGMLEPTMLTLLARAAGPRRSGRVMGLIGVVMPLGPVLGPMLGGVILEHLSWRWMFLVNLPVGVLAVVLAMRAVPADPPGDGRHEPLDVRGVALLSPAFAALVFALSQLGEDGVTIRVGIALVAGALLLGGYVVHALRTGTPPLIDLRLFTSRGFAASVTVMALIGVMLYSLLFLVPLYDQQVRGHGVLTAGLLLAPLGLGSLLGMPVAGRLSDRTGARRLVPAGAFLVVLATLAYTQADAATSQAFLAACLFVAGLGLGLAGAPTMGSVYRTVPAAAVARATSALFILNQLGASLGIAVAALLLQRRPGVPPEHAFSTAFWWVLTAAVIVLAASFALPGRPPRERGSG